jgi:hypothetical protein
VAHHEPQQRERPDGVDAEDRPPADRVDQQPGQDRPRGRGDGGRPRDGGHGAGLAARVGVGVRDDGQGGGDQRRARGALEQLRGDQQLERRGGRGEQPTRREHHQAGDHHPPGAALVAQHAQAQQQAGQQQRVAVDDPLQARHVRAEVVLDRGQRDVDHARGQHRQRERGGACDQRHPRTTRHGPTLRARGRAVDSRN